MLLDTTHKTDNNTNNSTMFYINISFNNLQVPLSFKAFDRSVELMLRRNDKIIAPEFQVWKHYGEDNVEELPELSKPTPCHYLHRNDFGSAAVSLCRQRGVVSIMLKQHLRLLNKKIS